MIRARTLFSRRFLRCVASGGARRLAPRHSLIPRFRSEGLSFFLSISHGVHARCTHTHTQAECEAGLKQRLGRYVARRGFPSFTRLRDIDRVLSSRLFTFASIVRRRPFDPRFRDLNPFLRVGASRRPISRASTSLANEPDDVVFQPKLPSGRLDGRYTAPLSSSSKEEKLYRRRSSSGSGELKAMSNQCLPPGGPLVLPLRPANRIETVLFCPALSPQTISFHSESPPRETSGVPFIGYQRLHFRGRLEFIKGAHLGIDRNVRFRLILLVSLSGGTRDSSQR